MQLIGLAYISQLYKAIIKKNLHFKKKFIYLTVSCGTWNLSSLTRDGTCLPWIGSTES